MINFIFVNIDDTELDLYLENFKKPKKPLKYEKGSNKLGSSKKEKTEEEQQIIMNKNKSKKGGLKMTKRNKIKRDMKMKVANVFKSQKKEHVKEEKLLEDMKGLVEHIKPKKEFNKDGNIVFSKVEFPKTGSKFDRPKKKTGHGSKYFI